MLRMEPFRYVRARTYAEALELYGASEAPMYCAGGTDLLPNLKHRLLRPATVIGLEIGGELRDTADGWRLDAGIRLDALSAAGLGPLSVAAGLVGSPQIRAMGTLGGNILLDTRCLYYNQTEFWRKSLGHCLKAEGTWCHVVGGPKTCVAAQSSDTVPVLLALGATLHLLGPEGERTLGIRDLYRFDGLAHLRIERGELLTAVTVPRPAPGFRGTYAKLRTRDSIDFPQLGVAICGVFDGPVPRALEIVVGAANPQPKPVRGLEAFLDRPLDAEGIAGVADLVYRQTRPQAAVHGDVAWRRQMASVLTRRGLAELVA